MFGWLATEIQLHNTLYRQRNLRRKSAFLTGTANIAAIFRNDAVNAHEPQPMKTGFVGDKPAVLPVGPAAGSVGDTNV